MIFKSSEEATTTVKRISTLFKRYFNENKEIVHSLRAWNVIYDMLNEFMVIANFMDPIEKDAGVPR